MSKQADGSTYLMVILDRSGSMQSIQSDMEGGLNRFIEEQKAIKGECKFTFIQFDDEYQVVLDNVELETVGKLTLAPRGSTALLDAMGKGLNKAKHDATAMGGHSHCDTCGHSIDGPKHKLVCVITDGFENASREWTRDNVFKLTRELEADGWIVTYLGANQDAIQVGHAYGTRSAHTMSFASSPAGVSNTMGTYSGAVAANRIASADVDFSDEDREAAVEP